jgi:hypothetical protein
VDPCAHASDPVLNNVAAGWYWLAGRSPGAGSLRSERGPQERPRRFEGDFWTLPFRDFSGGGVADRRASDRDWGSYTFTTLALMSDPRERLVPKIETEARAFANSAAMSSSLRLGRVYGLLEAGVIAGHWRKRDAAPARPLMRARQST